MLLGDSAPILYNIWILHNNEWIKWLTEQLWLAILTDTTGRDAIQHIISSYGSWSNAHFGPVMGQPTSGKWPETTLKLDQIAERLILKTPTFEDNQQGNLGMLLAMEPCSHPLDSHFWFQSNRGIEHAHSSDHSFLGWSFLGCCQARPAVTMYSHPSWSIVKELDQVQQHPRNWQDLGNIRIWESKLLDNWQKGALTLKTLYLPKSCQFLWCCWIQI